MAQTQWFLISTRPGFEKRVSDALTNKNIENYCPVVPSVKRSLPRKRVPTRALFTGMIFVRISDISLITSKRIDGFKSPVYWLNQPATIREREVEMIREFIAENAVIEAESCRVDQADMVRITTGPVIERSESPNPYSLVRITIPSIGKSITARVEREKADTPELQYNFEQNGSYEVAVN